MDRMGLSVDRRSSKIYDKHLDTTIGHTDGQLFEEKGTPLKPNKVRPSTSQMETIRYAIIRS